MAAGDDDFAFALRALLATTGEGTGVLATAATPAEATAMLGREQAALTLSILQALLRSSALRSSPFASAVRSHDDVKAYLRSLGAGQASEICGRLFTGGDLCYNCRQCQADPTCIQCETCFRASDHRGHDVSFHRAGAGGTCDCGDAEAWAAEGTCSRHGANARAHADEVRDASEAIEPTLRRLLQTCVREVLACVTRTCVQVSEAHGAAAFASLLSDAAAAAGTYSLVVHNDDVHTYDEVTHALRMHCGQPLADAVRLTKQVDKVGDAMVMTGRANASGGTTLRSAVDELTRMGLVFSIESPLLLRAQTRAAAALMWLQDMAGTGDAAAQLIAGVFCEDNAPLPPPAVTPSDAPVTADMARAAACASILGEVRFPQVGSRTLYSLIVHDIYQLMPVRENLQGVYTLLLKFTPFRTSLGLAFVSAFPVNSTRWMQGQGTAQDSIFDMSVHVLTVPTIVNTLLEVGSLPAIPVAALARALASTAHAAHTQREVDAIGRFGPAVTHTCVRIARVGSPALVLAPAPTLDMFSRLIAHTRYSPMCLNIEYVCRIGSGGNAILRDVATLRTLLAGLELAQHMHPQVRAVDAHVGHETDEWEGAFNLSLTLARVGSTIATSCGVRLFDAASPHILPYIDTHSTARTRSESTASSVTTASVGSSVGTGHIAALTLPQALAALRACAASVHEWHAARSLTRATMGDATHAASVGAADALCTMLPSAPLTMMRSDGTAPPSWTPAYMGSSWLAVPPVLIGGASHSTFLGTLGLAPMTAHLPSADSGSFHVPLHRCIAQIMEVLTQTSTVQFSVVASVDAGAVLDVRIPLAAAVAAVHPALGVHAQYADAVCVTRASRVNATATLLKCESTDASFLAFFDAPRALASMLRTVESSKAAACILKLVERDSAWASIRDASAARATGEADAHGLTNLHHAYTTMAWLDYPLRCMAMAAQARVGLWVRNGESFAAQVQHYGLPVQSTHMYDRDLHAVQAGLCMLPPQPALLAVLHRFEILPLFDIRMEQVGARDASVRTPRSARMLKREGMRTVLPEVLRMLVNIVTETPISARGAVAPTDAPFALVEGASADAYHTHGYTMTAELEAEALDCVPADAREGESEKRRRSGEPVPIAPPAAGTNALSSISIEAPAAVITQESRLLALRRELIHALVSGPKPRSALTRAASLLYARTGKVDDTAVSRVLAAIADYRPPSATEAGMYVLKDACFGEYDPAFPHLRPQQHSEAREAWVAKRKGAAATAGLHTGAAGLPWLDRATPSTPCPPPCHPAYVHVRRMLHTVAFAHVSRVLLTDALAAAPTLASEASTQLIMQLLTLAVHTWPCGHREGAPGEGSPTVSDVTARAWSAAHLVLPYGHGSESTAPSTAAASSSSAAATDGGGATMDTDSPALGAGDKRTRAQTSSAMPTTTVGASTADTRVSMEWLDVDTRMRVVLGMPPAQAAAAVAENNICSPWLAATASQPGTSIIQLLYHVAKRDALAAEVRESAAWCLSRLRSVHALTRSAVDEVLQSELTAAAAAAAEAEGKRKADMDAKRKAAQARAMAAMASKQANALRALDDEGDAEADAAASGEVATSGDASAVLDEAYGRVCRNLLLAPSLHSAEAASAAVTIERGLPVHECILCSDSGDKACAFLAFSEAGRVLPTGADAMRDWRRMTGAAAGWHANAQVVEDTAALTPPEGWARPVPPPDAHAVLHVCTQPRRITTRKPTRANWSKATHTDVSVPSAYLYAPSSLDIGVQVTFCGHIAHVACISAYTASAYDRAARGNVVEGDKHIRYDYGEFLCPLCRSVCNLLVPADAARIGTAAVMRNDARSMATSPLLQMMTGAPATVLTSAGGSAASSAQFSPWQRDILASFGINSDCRAGWFQGQHPRGQDARTVAALATLQAWQDAVGSLPLGRIDAAAPAADAAGRPGAPASRTVQAQVGVANIADFLLTTSSDALTRPLVGPRNAGVRRYALDRFLAIVNTFAYNLRCYSAVVTDDSALHAVSIPAGADAATMGRTMYDIVAATRSVGDAILQRHAAPLAALLGVCRNAVNMLHPLNQLLLEPTWRASLLHAASLPAESSEQADDALVVDIRMPSTSRGAVHASAPAAATVVAASVPDSDEDMEEEEDVEVDVPDDDGDDGDDDGDIMIAVPPGAAAAVVALAGGAGGDGDEAAVTAEMVLPMLTAMGYDGDVAEALAAAIAGVQVDPQQLMELLGNLPAVPGVNIAAAAAVPPTHAAAPAPAPAPRSTDVASLHDILSTARMPVEYDPLIHHCLRAPIAALLANGSVELAPSGMERPCAALSTGSLQAPRELAAFLLEGVSMHSDASVPAAPQVCACLPPATHPPSADTIASTVRGDVRGSWLLLRDLAASERLLLANVNASQLLLLLLSMSPTMDHSMHACAAAYVLALAQAAIQGATGGREGGNVAHAWLRLVAPLLRTVEMLLPIMEAPLRVGNPSASGVGVMTREWQAFIHRADVSAWVSGAEDPSDSAQMIVSSTWRQLPSGLHAADCAGALSALHAITQHFQLQTAASDGVVAASGSSSGSTSVDAPSSVALARAAAFSAPRVSLIQLPDAYDKLFTLVVSATCSACNKKPADPALCLVCGQLLCGGSTCCRMEDVGECTLHARVCGGGVGVFLLLQSAQTLLLRGEFAAYFPSPYVDEHGEQDVELRRGKPLYLQPARYAALQEMWARHHVGREVTRIRNTADRFIKSNYY